MYFQQFIAIFALLVSIGLMIVSFTRCLNRFDGHCSYAKFGGPLFAVAVSMLYCSYVISLSLRLLDGEKQGDSAA
jgi:hypothetical protein